MKGECIRITWYTNACVRISSSTGVNILCDPWVNPGAFLGSWFHWPPLPTNFEDTLLSEPCNGIYISHLHPDHYDPKFIAKYSKFNPTVPIYIAEFAHTWLKRSVAAVVHPATQVIEISPLGSIELEDGFTMKVFAADACNPIICGTNIPCQSEPKLRGIDSIAVFKADNFTVVNANDAMAINLVSRVAVNIGKADMIMGHYGGASPFPQCFPEVPNKNEAAMQIVDTTCKMLVSAADALDVDKIMPFAGQYMLGGDLAHLNDARATIPLDDAVRYLGGLTSREVVSIAPGESIDLLKGVQGKSYVEPEGEIKQNYTEKISRAKFSYAREDSKAWINIHSDLITAAKPVLARSALAKIAIKNSFVIGDGKNFVTINLDPAKHQSSVELGSTPRFENVTTIIMPTKLLKQLSTRVHGFKGFTPMHWNQADVGSHFTWNRHGVYDAASHALLNFYGV